LSAKGVSRLERYVTVLQAFEDNGYLTIYDLERKTRLGQATLLSALKFLEKQEYVKSADDQDDALFQITSKGNSVCRYFGKALQITDYAK
jgi:DNA-binding PadR family transcriptional regulator